MAAHYDATAGAGADADVRDAALEAALLRGYYVESGAFDGLFQSNSRILDEYACWAGLLIEPSRKFHALAGNRPAAAAVRGALVPPELDNTTIPSGIDDSPTNSAGHDVGTGLTDAVPARTLASFLAAAGMADHRGVTLWSLDVEGLELGAIRGMGPYRPAFVLVEVTFTTQDDPDHRAHVYDALAARGYVLHAHMGPPIDRPPMIQDSLFRYVGPPGPVG